MADRNEGIPEIPAGDDVEMLAWDSAFFGFPVARVRGARLAADAAARAIRWCEDHRVRCLYFLADFDDAATIRAAEDHGFRLVDARLRLECRPELRTHYFRNPPSVPIAVRRQRASDLPGLREIARTGYTATRFFFDSRFPRDRAEALYETWVDRACATDDDAVFVAMHEDRIAGFITCRALRAESAGEIGLAGVAPDARRLKVGSVLVNAALAWFEEEGFETARVVTQARNIPAQRLYQQFGFVSESMLLWYHRWF